MCGSLRSFDYQARLEHPTNPWFAVAVRTRWERAVESSIVSKGYTCFVPVFKERRRWSDRWKEIESPLFPGYVFSQLDIGNRLPVLTSPGVLYIVGTGRLPTPVDPEEISAIQLVARSGFVAKPHPYLQVGQAVSIGEGPLTGLRGFVLKIKSEAKLILSVTLLRRSIAVEIDKTCVSALNAAA